MSSQKLEMFSAAWYDEYFARADSSKTHAEFCERVYGKNLCQHGLMNMDELDFLISLIPQGSKVLELGCSNGYISEYIQEKTASEYLAVDYSAFAINQAAARTKDKQGQIEFVCLDFSSQEVPDENFDFIIMIDSIYFMGEYDQTLRRLKKNCRTGGKLLVTYFETLEEEDEREEVPQANETWLAGALKKLNIPYIAYDFSAHAKAHGLKNYAVGEDLKEAFMAEGNEFLYQARADENRFFKKHAENDTIVRYLYVMDA